MILEECKYVIKEKNVEISSDFEKKTLLKKNLTEKTFDYKGNSDEEILEKIQIKKIVMKKILVKKMKCFSTYIKYGKKILSKIQRKTPKKACDRYQNLSEKQNDERRKKSQ